MYGTTGDADEGPSGSHKTSVLVSVYAEDPEACAAS